VKVEIHIPQRGDKRRPARPCRQNAKLNYEQRFRVAKPSQKALQEALQDALTLPTLPKRIECFDISHFQRSRDGRIDGRMARWQNGKERVRKIIIKTVKVWMISLPCVKWWAAVINAFGMRIGPCQPHPDRRWHWPITRCSRRTGRPCSHWRARRIHRQA